MKVRSKSNPSAPGSPVVTAALSRNLVRMAKTIAHARKLTVADVFDSIASPAIMAEFRRVVKETEDGVAARKT